MPNPDTEKAWIQVASGGILHVLDPRQEEINIVDIAHALSMMCRFTGHVRNFYSVAEHALHCSFLVPEEDALWALLHDAPEYALADLNRPVKHFTNIGEEYSRVEKTIMNAICEKFGLQLDEPESVLKADNAMLYAEKEQLLPFVEWTFNWTMNPKAADRKVRCWSPEIAKTEFLHRFFELTNQL